MHNLLSKAIFFLEHSSKKSLSGLLGKYHITQPFPQNKLQGNAFSRANPDEGQVLHGHSA
jgi:hypothetical protein